MVRFNVEDPSGFDCDRRPYLKGLETNDCFNIFKPWFKWNGLVNIWIKEEKFPMKKDSFGSDVDKSAMTPEQIARYEGGVSAIYGIEDTLRETFFEYAQEFEKSELVNNAYIDGLLDASTRVIAAPKSEDDVEEDEEDEEDEIVVTLDDGE